MAVIPQDLYPSQVDVDANYPQGKARNVAVEGDGVGTPLEKKWVNDLWGFEQKLLYEAGITPSGNPDHINTSDYWDALSVTIRSGVPGKADSIVLEVPIVPVYVDGATTGYDAALGVWKQTSTSALVIHLALQLPQACIVDAVTVVLEGGTGHSALPFSMPAVSFFNVSAEVGDAAFGAINTIASAADTSVDVTAYELVHEMTIASIAHTVDQSDSAAAYLLEITGESGADAMANQLKIARVTITVQKPV